MGVMGWIVNTSKQNIWRVSEWYDLDDLIQDGLYWYCYCRHKYKDVQTPEHFMALLKRTFTNHITDLANKRTRSVPTIYIDDLATQLGETVSLENIVELQQEWQTLYTVLAQAPKEVADFFRALMSDASIALLAPYARHGRVRETTNERFCGMLGLDPEKVDLVGMIRAALSPT
jgi:hypothetical protein